ncbi:MAG: DegT/DnrJ/EryC1/StrS family aminotransferase, partial [bacterium]
EGGMVTTNDPELARKIRCLSLHGMSRDAWKRYSAEGSWYYEVIFQGYKYNMPDILAALGLSQLKKVEEMFKVRSRYAKIYEEQLSGLEALITPKASRDVRHAWHLYIIRLQTERLKITRNDFIQKLKAAGIGTSVHFVPLHLHPFYQRKFGYKYGDFPVAEKVYKSAISLPLYPKMTQEQVYYVVSKVKELLKEHQKPTLFPGYEILSDDSRMLL